MLKKPFLTFFQNLFKFTKNFLKYIANEIFHISNMKIFQYFKNEIAILNSYDKKNPLLETLVTSSHQDRKVLANNHRCFKTSLKWTQIQNGLSSNYNPFLLFEFFLIIHFIISHFDFDLIKSNSLCNYSNLENEPDVSAFEILV